MKKCLLALFCLLSCTLVHAQRFGGERHTYQEDNDDEGPKNIYNYTYGSYYASSIGSPSGTHYAINSVTCLHNGRQQFGIGMGISWRNAKSDSGNMQFVSVPLFLSNKFFIKDDGHDGGIYIDFQAGFNLPVSAIFTTGESTGNAIPSENLRSTGFYGVSLGYRKVTKFKNKIAWIAELGYRNEPIPYTAAQSAPSGLFGLNLGVSL